MVANAIRKRTLDVLLCEAGVASAMLMNVVGVTKTFYALGRDISPCVGDQYGMGMPRLLGEYSLPTAACIGTMALAVFTIKAVDNYLLDK